MSEPSRLAQWKTVRLLIQRSKFDSPPTETDEYFFLAVAAKCETPIYSNYSLQQKRMKAPSTGRKANFTFFLCVKGNVPTNWSYEVT